MIPGETLVLVDGSSLAFRSFYALLTSGLRRSDGTPTWAIQGFFNSLFDLLERYQPNGIAVCFDLAAPTFRHTEFEAYKANRQEMPDDLSVQWPIIKEAVTVLGIPVYELEGYEADDVIGTVAEEAKQKGIKVVILTGDQDAFQLIEDEGEAIQVLMPGKTGLSMYGREQVFEKLGIWPEQVIDYKALCGDTSDNIPGVRGIGPKTAAQLLSSFKTLDAIYENLDQIKSQSQRQKLIDGKESAYASQRLARIVRDVPLDFDFEHCYLVCPPLPVVESYFKQLEFKKLVGRLPQLLSRFSQDGTTPDSLGQLSLLSARDAEQADQERASRAGGGEITSVMLAEEGPALSELEDPTLITSQSDLARVVDEIESCGVFAFELETSSNDSLDCDILGIALAFSKGIYRDEEGGLNLKHENNGSAWFVDTAYVQLDQSMKPAVDLLLKPLLENPSIAKIAHNCKFKDNALSLIGIDLQGVSFDPMLASYIVNPDEKHGLKELCERALGYATVRSRESGASAGGRKQLTINFGEPDKIASTVADDARVTLELTRHYISRLDHDQRYLLFEMDLPLSTVLARMEQNGVALDLPYLLELSNELTGDLKRLEGEIYELAGHQFNINSTQQLQKVLFEELELTPKAKTKTKSGFSTDASVLEALVQEHAIIQRILDFRQLSKLRSTYVEALPRQVSKRDHRLHGEFNQTGTSTGRLSSSTPNLQNIPIRTEVGRRIRRAFVPQDKSASIISADYSQIELRLLAHMSGDETLIDAFAKDQDIHARTAGEIFDISIDLVTDEQRRIGKTLNFALVYQQGAFATAQALNITTKEASAFIEKYFARYPKVRGFLTQTINAAREDGFVTTLWGRRRHFRHLNDRNDVIRKADERAACNAPLQGSAADLMKLAMIRLDEELGDRQMKTKLIMQVHDELLLEVPDEELAEAKEIVTVAMQMDQPLKVPLRVDIGVGKNWMDAK